MAAGKSRRMKRLADIEWVVMSVEICGKPKGPAIVSDFG
jgi:hypothetical protein